MGHAALLTPSSHRCEGRDLGLNASGGGQRDPCLRRGDTVDLGLFILFIFKPLIPHINSDLCTYPRTRGRFTSIPAARRRRHERWRWGVGVTGVVPCPSRGKRITGPLTATGYLSG